MTEIDSNNTGKLWPGSSTELGHNFDFLCRVLGSPKNSLEQERIFNSLSESEWKKFWELCENQFVGEFVYQKLKQEKLAGLLPAALNEKWQTRLYRCAVRNTQLLESGHQLVQNLSNHGIEGVLLKGCFLQVAIFETGNIRPMNDIDILVKKEDVSKAIDELKKSGYELTTYFDKNYSYLDIKHVPPMKDQLGRLLELHWTLLEENEPFSIEMDKVWNRVRVYAAGEKQILGLSLEDILVHLAVHGSYQHFLRLGLRPLVDIQRVLAKYGNEVDWEKLAQISRDWNAEKTVWLTFRLAKEFLNLAIPDELLARLEPQDGPIIFEKAAESIRNLRPFERLLSPDLIEFMDTQSSIDKLKRIFRRIFLPKETMARLYNVSPSSLKIYTTYFRRVKDLKQQYLGTVEEMDAGSKMTYRQKSRYEQELKIHDWLGS